MSLTGSAFYHDDYEGHAFQPADERIHSNLARAHISHICHIRRGPSKNKAT
jgi:hypothetical protein